MKGLLEKLLQTCRSWGGPFTTQEELETILMSRPEIQERIVVELTYHRYTHKPDGTARPDVF